jgi:hypothetical protein
MSRIARSFCHANKETAHKRDRRRNCRRAGE